MCRSALYLRHGLICTLEAAMTPQRIKGIRAAYGEAQEVFAQRVGVSVWSIMAWEQARTPPSRLAVARLLQVERDAPQAVED